MLDPRTEGDARTSAHARACRYTHCEMSCRCWCHGITHHLAGGLRPDNMDRCECGHILQRVGEDRLLRCVMGCSYQTKRDASQLLDVLSDDWGLPPLTWVHTRMIEPHEAIPDVARAYIQPGTRRLEAPCLNCGNGEVVMAMPNYAEESQSHTESNPEDRMVVLRRHPDGTPSVWCDPEIADIVQALNAGGVPTVASCSGHGNRPGNVALTDGRELIIAANWAEAREVESAFPPFTNLNNDYTGRDQAVEAATDAIANHILTNWYEDIDPSEGQPEHAFVWNNAPSVAEDVVDTLLNNNVMFPEEEYPDDINESYWRERAREGWERVRALEAALPDPDNLEILADWFDARDAPGSSDEVQRDLREWARRARAVMGED